MDTRIDEIADGLFRLSTFVPQVAPPAGFTFNQFLVLGDEPLLFHTGMRQLFPAVSAALRKVLDPTALRWVSYGHFESDECGALNDWLALAPAATAAQGQVGVGVSLADFALRPPRALDAGETLDLGRGKRVRFIETPHAPHGWDAAVMFEESTRTLLGGDLFTQLGDGPALTREDIVGPAIAAEDLFRSSALHPSTPRILRGLADLAPRTLALMHGPAFEGDGAEALRALASDYERRIGSAAGRDTGQA